MIEIIIKLIELFSLGLGQNQSFGPKQNTKFGVRTTHPPPKTFWRVPGIVGGQDLVCRLPIVQGATAHSFDPPLQIFLTQKCFGTEFFLDKIFFRPKTFSGPNIFQDPKFFSFFFGPKIFLDLNFFWTRIFFDQKFF